MATSPDHAKLVGKKSVNVGETETSSPRVSEY